MKRLIIMLLLCRALFPVFAGQLYSPAWGFRLDLPEGYELIDDDGSSRFSFAGPNGALFNIAVYSSEYNTVQNMVNDINRRLENSGQVDFFDYNGRSAAIVQLSFMLQGEKQEGWSIGVELAANGLQKKPPLLLALSYAPAPVKGMELYHMSALDSIAPTEAEQRYPGPVMEYAYPRGEQKKTSIARKGVEALIREHDAEAAQILVDREFALLRNYLFQDNWQEAWRRFYRAVYRDSWDRVADAVFRLERSWNEGAPKSADRARAERTFAEKALAWVQGFQYERDLMGSDFVNLVSAVTDGRGDCDSRAMLWALILAQADIPAAIMVSRNHSHAMGLADLAGDGARFEAGGKKWLVAETTAKTGIGLIGKNVSDVDSWLGVLFE